MATLSAGNLVSLRTEQARASIYLSVFQPVTLLTALVNNAGATRGMRSIAFDTGTGSGFATIAAGQTLEVDTAGGTKKTFVKSISGTQTAGTIELYENSINWADNQVLRIKHLYEPHPVPPAIRSGVFYKFFDIPYTTQNTTPSPVAIIGSHRAGFLSAGSIAFSLNSSSSYAIASGATISSRVWSCVHNGGATTGISFSSTTAANPTLTITEAGTYWLKCIVTDSNGQIATTYRALFVYDRGVTDPYTDFTISSFTGDWQSGGWKVSLQATGDVELSDFPDGSLAVLWYENTYSGVAGYVNLWSISNEILTCGYLRQDNSQDDFSKGTGATTFQITTIDDLINNVAPLGSVSLNAAASPVRWWQYASWMTTGRSIHHLLFWHAWGVFQCADVIGLASNTLGVKTTDYTEGSLLQQVNGFAHDRGIHAKLICDRLGRLHLVEDSQMLNTAARAALDTVFTLTEADVSGGVDVARAPEETTTFTQLDGFSFNGTTSTPFISIIPGYRESSISYIMPEERGGNPAAVSNQVLANQTDSNERVGRHHAKENNNPRELRFSNPYNGIGAFDIIPSIGWYSWGIASATLKRNTELFGKKFVCRNINVRFNHPAGTILTDVVLEREAIGPDGIQGNYPTGYPTTAATPTPDWDSGGAGGGVTSDFIVAYSNNSAVNGEAVVGVLGSPTTFGTPVEFQTAGCGDIATCALSATKAVVCYNNSSLGRAKVLDIAGTVITPATVATFNGAASTWISCAALSATKVIVTYRDTDTFGKAVILDISGSTITPGSEVTFHGVNVVSTCVTRLSATKAIVSYVNNVTQLANTCVLDVSGSTITANTPQPLTGGDADYTSICSLSSTSAVMAYRDSSDASLKAVALTGITTTVTYGTIAVLDNTNLAFDNVPGMPFVRKIDGSRAAITYQTDNGSPFTIRLIVVSHASGILTPGTSIAMSDAGYDEFPTVIMPNTATAMVLFDRSAVGTDGLYSTAAISGTTATYNGDQAGFEGDSISVLASAELKAVA